MRRLIIEPSGALRGSTSVPGDKSISHRALLLGALARGDTLVTGWLPGEDCQATLRCMRALGVEIEQRAETELLVHGAGDRGLLEPEDVLDCGGSGTTMRLLAGILAGQPFTSVMTGNPALRRRPMGRVADPLRSMGAQIVGRQGGKLPPLTISGGHLHAIRYDMPVASAQVKSAILLAGLFAEGITEVIQPGPARDHTERMLRMFGVDVSVDGNRISIAGGQRLRTTGVDAEAAGHIAVPGDFSSAAFPLVAAAIVPGSSIVIHDVGANPTRTGLMDLLSVMGADVRTASGVGSGSAGPVAGGESTSDLTVSYSELRACDASGDLIVRSIDEFPIFAVAATQAHGTTVVSEAAELRVKESDRISAVARELARLGAEIEERPDGLIIHGPSRLHGAVVDSHRDHRLAMALAVAGLAADGRTEIEQAEVLDDSFPGFVEMMQSLGGGITWDD